MLQYNFSTVLLLFLLFSRELYPPCGDHLVVVVVDVVLLQASGFVPPCGDHLVVVVDVVLLPARGVLPPLWWPPGC